jgi:hypothetical protein
VGSTFASWAHNDSRDGLLLVMKVRLWPAMYSAQSRAHGLRVSGVVFRTYFTPAVFCTSTAASTAVRSPPFSLNLHAASPHPRSTSRWHLVNRKPP